jgi:predicted DCC family thiol-disulfide oxidoreductase YuxK
MTPPPPPTGYTLLFDGECDMCRAAVAQLQRLGLLQRVSAVGVTSQDVLESRWPEEIHQRLRKEVLLSNPEQAELIGGPLVFITLAQLHQKFSLLVSLYHLPGAAWIARHVYNLVAYNRRILSPLPYTPIPCACDPPVHRGYQLGFWASILLLAWGSVGLYGATLSPQGFWRLPLALFLMWGLEIVLFMWADRKQWMRLVQQSLLVKAQAGIFIGLWAAILLWGKAFLPQQGDMWLHGIGLLGFCLLGLYLLRRRLLKLRAPAWLVWFWVVLFLSGVLVSR